MSKKFVYPNPDPLAAPRWLFSEPRRYPRVAGKMCHDLNDLTSGLIQASVEVVDYPAVTAGNLLSLPNSPSFESMSDNQHVNACVQGLLRSSQHFR